MFSNAGSKIKFKFNKNKAVNTQYNKISVCHNSKLASQFITCSKISLVQKKTSYKCCFNCHWGLELVETK